MKKIKELVLTAASTLFMMYFSVSILFWVLGYDSFIEIFSRNL